GKSGLVIMRPMVHLTMMPGRLAGSDDMFTRFAAASELPSRYWWYLCPALFINAAVRRGAFSRERFIDIVEVTFDGRRDRLAHSVLVGLCQQMLYSLESSDPNQRVPVNQIDMINALFPESANGVSYVRVFRTLRRNAEEIELLAELSNAGGGSVIARDV